MFRYAAIIIILFFSCKMGTIKYYNKKKWGTPAFFSGHPMKADPFEIKQDLYVNIDDSTINAKGELNGYDIWRFNRDGDLDYTKRFISDSLWSETFSNYSKDGYRSSTYVHGTSGKPDTSNTSCSLLENGGFKRVTERRTPIDTFFHNPSYLIESFADNGNIAKEESFYGTSGSDPDHTLITYYAGQRILKQVGIRKKDTTDFYVYFYSKEKFLDSIRYIIERKYARKDIFINDQFGNPVKYFKVMATGDTLSVRLMQYKYDQYGNWIRMLEKITGKDQLVLGIKRNPYSLLIRTIKYTDK